MLTWPRRTPDGRTPRVSLIVPVSYRTRVRNGSRPYPRRVRVDCAMLEHRWVIIWGRQAVRPGEVVNQRWFFAMGTTILIADDDHLHLKCSDAPPREGGLLGHSGDGFVPRTAAGRPPNRVSDHSRYQHARRRRIQREGTPRQAGPHRKHAGHLPDRRASDRVPNSPRRPKRTPAA